MTFHRIFFAQDSEVTLRDMKVKFGRDAAWYVYLGHRKNDGYTTTRNSFDEGSVLPIVPIICTLLHKMYIKKVGLRSV